MEVSVKAISRAHEVREDEGNRKIQVSNVCLHEVFIRGNGREKKKEINDCPMVNGSTIYREPMGHTQKRLIGLI